MFSKQSKLKDKTTQVVGFDLDKKIFNYQGIDFQIYPDTRNPRTPDLALKRNDTKQPKRISGLYFKDNILSGDIRTEYEKRYFTLQVIPEEKAIKLEGFTRALELLGIRTPIEQNNLFTGHSGASERGIYLSGASGMGHQNKGGYMSV